MLIIKRKLDEAIVIDHKTVVRISEIAGGRVKLLIYAPREIAVNREEVEQGLVIVKPQPE